MSCGCANRMRIYVLPTLGFTLSDGIWTNLEFQDETLRTISDDDVEEKHTSLTIQLLKSWTTSIFLDFWTSATNSSSANNYLRDAALATDPKRWLETLSFSEQFERICSMYVLPNLGYAHFDNDVWKADTQIGNLPLEFRADRITREHENILQASMIGKTKEEFLDWWNNLVPSALWLSPEEYDRILVSPITPCNNCR